MNGDEYVVFTYSEEGELWTGKCSRTHALRPGEIDADLSWMRGLATAPAGPTIYGKLVLPKLVTGLDGPATLTVRGPENHEIAADQKGQYALSGLNPGQYTVSVALPRGLMTGDAVKLTVQDKGCAEVDWPVYYDGHIRGQVTEAGGHALRSVDLVLERRDPNSATGLAQVGFADTDRDGRYDFPRVPPGDYLVAANFLGPSPTRPYPRVYYPDANSDARAATLHMAASAVADDINLTLPNAWNKVTVLASVLLPDGSPASGADVEAHDADYLWSGEPGMATAGTDGRAALPVYEGRTYYLTATISGGTQQRCAGPLKFTARDGLVLEPIRIEHNWGNCLAQLNPNFQPPN